MSDQPFPSASPSDVTRNDHTIRVFVEELSVGLESEGLPRIAGRIFGFLLVCQPPEQTAADLARELHASRGSVSTMTQLLLRTEMIERVSRAGQRADRFRVPDGALSALMRREPPRLAYFTRLTARGLDLLAGQPPEARSRLQELHDLFAYFARAFPALLDEWERQRAEESR